MYHRVSIYALVLLAGCIFACPVDAQTNSKLTVADIEALFRADFTADDVLQQIEQRGLAGALRLGEEEGKRWERAGGPARFHIRVLGFLGADALEHGDYETALTFFRRLLELDLDPGVRVLILRQVGLVYHQTGQLQEAIRWYTRGLEIQPTERLLFQRGMAYLEAGDLRAATQDSERLIKDLPDQYRGYLLLARIQRGLQKLDAAIKSAEVAAKLSRGYWKAVALLAELHADRGNFDAAVKFQIEALNSAPEAVRPHLRKILTHYQSRRPVDHEAERRRKLQEERARQKKQQLRGVLEQILENMVPIESGEFQMGSETEYDESPVHTVRVSAFHLGRYEVTRHAYYTIMGEPELARQDPNLPVESVSFEDCQAFIVRLNKNLNGVKFRLPTEAEWEYAARGGTGVKNLEQQAWYQTNSQNQTQPVGQKTENGFGLHDMLGNVWEWCSDRYGAYSAEESQDPVGATSGLLRVIRGGGRSNTESFVRVSARGVCPPTETLDGLGFRLATGSTSNSQNQNRTGELTLEQLNRRIDELRQLRDQGVREHDRQLGSLYVERAQRHHEAKDYRKALADLEESLPLFASADDRGRSGDALARIAWILATCPQKEVRDGARAYELAKTACSQTGYHEWRPILSLAVAHAELGHFDLAVRRAEEAIDKAYLETELEQDLSRQVLDSLRARQPWRES